MFFYFLIHVMRYTPPLLVPFHQEIIAEGRDIRPYHRGVTNSATPQQNMTEIAAAEQRLNRLYEDMQQILNGKTFIPWEAETKADKLAVWFPTIGAHMEEAQRASAAATQRIRQPPSVVLEETEAWITQRRLDILRDLRTLLHVFKKLERVIHPRWKWLRQEIHPQLLQNCEAMLSMVRKRIDNFDSELQLGRKTKMTQLMSV